MERILHIQVLAWAKVRQGDLMIHPLLFTLPLWAQQQSGRIPEDSVEKDTAAELILGLGLMTFWLPALVIILLAFIFIPRIYKGRTQHPAR